MSYDSQYILSLSLSNPDPGFWWLKVEKSLQLNKKCNIFLIKNCNLLIPRPPLRTSKLRREKPSSLKREYPALQNMDHFCPPGSTDLIESGSETLISDLGNRVRNTTQPQKERRKMHNKKDNSQIITDSKRWRQRKRRVDAIETETYSQNVQKCTREWAKSYLYS